jgi:hypothetical protein
METAPISVETPVSFPGGGGGVQQLDAKLIMHLHV